MGETVVIYRPFPISPQRATLLGMIWIAVRWNQERGDGAYVSPAVLGDLIFAAQSRELVERLVHFRFDSKTIPHAEALDLRSALEALKRDGFLHIPETGDTIGFLGSSYVDLPVGIFRHINFPGFTELVKEFLGGERD